MKTTVVTFRLNIVAYNKLKIISKIKDRTISYQLRKMIENYLLGDTISDEFKKEYMSQFKDRENEESFNKRKEIANRMIKQIKP